MDLFSTFCYLTGGLVVALLGGLLFKVVTSTGDIEYCYVETAYDTITVHGYVNWGQDVRVAKFDNFNAAYEASKKQCPKR